MSFPKTPSAPPSNLEQVVGGNTPSGPTIAPIAPAPTQQPSALPTLPTFGAPAATSSEAPWDTMGRLLWGKSEQGGINPLAQVPVVGDIGRGLGEVGRAGAGVVGLGVQDVVDTTANVLGKLPSTSHLTDNFGLGSADEGKTFSDINAYDTGKYGPSASGFINLITDLQKKNGSGNMADQFLKVGQWMRVNAPGDPYNDWQKTLADAQAQSGAPSAELISNFMRKWSVTFADMTPEGTQGLYDVMPEMAYGSEGSLGQGFADGLKNLILLQRKAERGAGYVSGTQGGLPALIGEGTAHERLSSGNSQFGARLDELMALAPSQRTDVENQAVAGLQTGGWTSDHAMNYLVAHGQGFSSSGPTELALSFALDPINVATLGSAETASVAARVGQYANTAESATMVSRAYTGFAKQIGTTVAAVRADPILGGAAKVVHTIIDPLSAFPGVHGAGQADAFGAAGLKGTEQGFGRGAVKSAMNQADAWGVRGVVDEAFGQTAMNFARKWAIGGHVGNMLRAGEGAIRQVIPESLIETVGKSAPKDAVARLADYVYKKREYWMSSADVDQLSERIAKMVGKPIEDIRPTVEGMSANERALWHAMSYSKAYKDFIEAKSAVAPAEWGGLSKRLDDVELLNPHDMDRVTAADLAQQVAEAKTTAEKVALWNAAADKYSAIGDLGRATEAAGVEKLLGRLQRGIDAGRFHSALDAAEMADVPEAFKHQFLDAWVDSQGQPIWRLGFKPRADQASGLIANESGVLEQAFEPSIDNVTTAIPKLPGRPQPLTDALGRVIKGSNVGRLADSVDVMARTAMDHVSSERMITSMEQSFVGQMRSAGYSARTAKEVFRVSRDAASEHGFTLAGMNPEEFWKAAGPTLKGTTEEAVAKREVFGMLAKAAGGDLRTLGLSSGLTQRIRAAAIASGLDPQNYLGAVTVKMYNALRYALNPTFAIQAATDAPWFNMLRGVPADMRGALHDLDTPIGQMERITNAIGKTGVYRDLSLDYTERIQVLGWQNAMRQRLGMMPGVSEGIGAAIEGNVSRRTLNNQMLFMNSRVGEIVQDALDQTRAGLQHLADNAESPEQRALYEREMQQVPMMDWLKEQYTEAFGKVPSTEELGRWYLSDMIDDSRLEMKTAAGALDYSNVMKKAGYFKAADVGQLHALDLDYGAESLKLPNIHNIIDLRTALKNGERTTSEVRNLMLENGYAKDNVDRFVSAMNFNWRDTFDGLRQSLGMTQYEMQGIEHLLQEEAKQLGVPATDFVSQVLDHASIGGVSAHASAALDVLRAFRKGPEALDQLTATMVGTLHPSMRQTLLDHFVNSLTGSGGEIERAMAAGNTKRAQDLNQIVEALRGGWGPEADKQFRDLVMERAGLSPSSLRAEPLPGVRPAQFETVTDAAKGVAKAREDAQGYMRSIGRELPAERRYVQVDPEFGLKTARAYDALPDAGVVKSGKPVTQAQLESAGTKLKAVDVPPEVRSAYQAFVDETKAQYDYIRAQGVDIVPVAKDPYANSAAMMADVRDNGRLQVFAGSAGHPLMTDAQNVMFRGVHDYFAHASEGFQFGARGEANAAIKHSQMYSEEAQKAMLTETHGQNSYVNFSDKGVQTTAAAPVAQQKLATNADEWTALHPDEPNAVLAPVVERGPRGGRVNNLAVIRTEKAVGPNLRAASSADQKVIFETLDRLSRRFPILGKTLKHVEIADLGKLREPGDTTSGEMGFAAQGLTVGSIQGKPALFIDNQMVGPGAEDNIAELAFNNRGVPGVHKYPRDVVSTDLPGVVTHESGHPIDDYLRYVAKDKGYIAFIKKAQGNANKEARRQIGAYAAKGDDAELGAELFNAAYGTHDVVFDPEAQRLIDEYKAMMVAGGHDLGEGAVAAPVAQGAVAAPVTRTVAEINKEAPGTIYAQQKAALLPDNILDEFRARYAPVKNTPLPIDDPEVERAARYWSEWLQGPGKALDPATARSDMMRTIAENVPTKGASPANLTQSLLIQHLSEGFRLSEKDAIRLAAVSTDRTVLERSLNHPFFAMYPTSYFWGKVIPETLRFVAQEPFGIKSDLGLLTTYKLQQELALQAQYDPRMAELEQKLGKSAVIGLLSYLTPGLPSDDMKVKTPPWLAAFQQGKGLTGALKGETDTIAPTRWFQRAVQAGQEGAAAAGAAAGAVGSDISGQQQQQLQNISTQPSNAPATPAPTTSGPTPGTQLGPTLESQLEELQKVISGR